MYAVVVKNRGERGRFSFSDSHWQGQAHRSQRKQMRGWGYSCKEA